MRVRREKLSQRIEEQTTSSRKQARTVSENSNETATELDLWKCARRLCIEDIVRSPDAKNTSRPIS